MSQTLIGYVRPGAAGPDPEEQCATLARLGCEPIFVEKDGATPSASRQRGRALRSLNADTTLIFTHLDRLGQSLVDIAAVLQRLFEAGAALHIVDGDIHTRRDPAARRALVAMVGGQHRLVSERARTGLAQRRAAGKRVGPPARLQPEDWPELKAMIAAKTSAAVMAAHFKVTRQTLWNFRQRMEAAEADQSDASSANS